MLPETLKIDLFRIRIPKWPDVTITYYLQYFNHVLEVPRPPKNRYFDTLNWLYITMWPQEMQLGWFWGVFGLPLGSLCAPFGPPCAPFGLHWGVLGAPWEHFGTTLRLLKAILKVFGTSFGCVGATLRNVLAC